MATVLTGLDDKIGLAASIRSLRRAAVLNRVAA
jgi:hypothetical protein